MLGFISAFVWSYINVKLLMYTLGKEETYQRVTCGICLIFSFTAFVVINLTVGFSI